jgi:pyruvate,orthophosphate dikinase
MTTKNSPNEKTEELGSSALKVNLERTAVTIEIPEQYAPLLQVVASHYGLQKKTRELLMELNHPLVNWEYVLKELKSISIGNFYIYNNHQDGLSALSMMLRIYFDVIKSALSKDIKDSAIHYLFDYIDTILTQSNEFLPRNLVLFSEITESLMNIADRDEIIFKKCSTYLKRIIKSITENNIDIHTPVFDSLVYRMFKVTYQFWLTQPDPFEWFTQGDGETAESINAYRQFIQPLSHQHLQALLEKLETLRPDTREASGDQIKRYLDMPDYFQIVNGYLLAADLLEKSQAHQGRQHLAKLGFLYNIMDIPSLADIHASALREINHALNKVFQEEKRKT